MMDKLPLVVLLGIVMTIATVFGSIAISLTASHHFGETAGMLVAILWLAGLPALYVKWLTIYLREEEDD